MKFLRGKNKIKFDPVEHKYTLDGENFPSVSTLIHLYCPPFDPTGEIIARCAAKRGITVAELRKEWDFERDSACDRGHTLHSEAEHWIDTAEINEQGQYVETVRNISKIPFVGRLKSETVIYSENFKLAGTVDVIEQFPRKYCNIWDFKQNKKLSMKSFFERGKGYSYMLYPVNHLMNCNFVHYSLQLHIYALILEDNGYTVGEKRLIYVPPNTTEIQVHPVLELKAEAKAIISHFSF